MNFLLGPRKLDCVHIHQCEEHHPVSFKKIMKKNYKSNYPQLNIKEHNSHQLGKCYYVSTAVVYV